MDEGEVRVRQVVIDTETTGLEVSKGHRIVEIGCVELLERRPTGREFHRYLNPQRAMDEGARAVSGISDEFLRDKPLFSEIVVELLQFIDGAELVAHNAAFDIGFLDAELARLDMPERIAQRAGVLDTLALAREKYPGQKNSLDALCKRLGVDNSHRELHGALLDAQLLAEVYLAMTAGQGLLGFGEVAREFLDFIRGAEIIAHNAEFDVGFIDNALGLAGDFGKLADHATVLDSLALAREKFPGQRNSLDALCRRLGVDNSHRELHGALLDAQLLAEVYLAMTAGQGLLGFGEETAEQVTRVVSARVQITVRPRVLRALVDEIAAHVARLEAIEKASKGACLWRQLAADARITEAELMPV